MTQLPSPDTDYAAPLDMALTKASWDAAMVSIGTRLRGLEAVEADFQTVVEQLEGQALAVIQTNIAPILATLREEIIELRAQILLAEDAVSILLAGNLPAENILFTPAAGIAANNVQAALVEVANDVAAAPTAGTAIALALALG
jgi:hypothetical protein